MKNQYIGIFCASSNTMAQGYYEQAERLGRWIAEQGRVLVYGGANCGLMEATARAVRAGGGEVVGVVPAILMHRNRVSTQITTIVHCEDLSDRKQQLIDRSDIIIVMPGSVGTLDEVFSVMAANTIGIHDKRVVLWNIDGFWDELLLLFEALERKGVVNKPMAELMTVVRTFEELTEVL